MSLNFAAILRVLGIMGKTEQPGTPSMSPPVAPTGNGGVETAAQVTAANADAPFTLTSDMISKWTGRTSGDYAALADAFNSVTSGVIINGVACSLKSKAEQQMFLAQALCETGGFSAMVENLFYSSPDRIVAVWPTRFNYNGQGKGPLDASKYAKNPQALANAVYANRVGNGNEASGDGYNFRGRGVGFQLTFRGNYAACSQALYGDDRLVTNPDQVATDHEVGFAVGMWFWTTNGLGDLVATKGLYGSLIDVTKRINGSTSTVPERKAWLDKVTAP